MHASARAMVGHGAIVTFFGLAAGFGLVMSLIGGFELFPGSILAFDIPGDSRAWARTHAGGLMNGMLVLIGALLVHNLELEDRFARRLQWMLVGAGYANTLFYWGGMLSPSRALTLGDNRLGESNLAGIIGFAPALIFAFVTMAAMLMLVAHAFGSSGAKPEE